MDTENLAARLAIAQLVANPTPQNRTQLLRCLKTGVLIVGVKELPFPGEMGTFRVTSDLEIQTLHANAPDGSPALAAFTDAEALQKRSAVAKPLVLPAVDVLKQAAEVDSSGLVLNLAGPWAFVSRAEIDEILRDIAKPPIDRPDGGE